MELASTKQKITASEGEISRLEDEIGRFNVAISNYESQIAKNDEFIASAEEMIKQKLASAPSSAKKQELESIIAKRSEVESNKGNISIRIKELDSQKASLMAFLCKKRL